jgi:streptogramin lyase
MFSDIVASSSITETLGDARWRILLGRHNDLIRRELGRHGGRELDTAGDGFFTAFDDPVAAVRCAAAIVEGVQALGLDVRIGLHFGRIEWIGRKPGGVVVHIGARVMALAGPAEILLTGTLRDLIPGGGFRFEDRGRHALKGINDEWPVYRLAETDGRPLPEPLDPEQAAARREQIQRPPFVRRRRVRIAGAAAALLVAATLGALALRRPTTTVGPPHRITLAKALLRIDPGTRKIMATFPLRVALSVHGGPISQTGDKVRAVAVGPEGSVWVTNGDDNSITRLDPATGRMTAIRVPDGPRSIAIGPNAVWVVVDGAPVVDRIDPATNRVKLSVSLSGFAYAVAADAATGVVWALTNASVERIDPISNTVTATVPIPGLAPAGPNLSFFPFVNLGMTVDRGSLWIPIPNGDLIQVDEVSNRVVKHLHPAERLAEVAVDDSTGSVWVTSSQLGGAVGGLIELDASTGKVQGSPLALSCCPGNVAVGEGGIWVTDERNETVTELSAATRDVAGVVHLPGRPSAITVGDSAVWVTIDAPSG